MTAYQTRGSSLFVDQHNSKTSADVLVCWGDETTAQDRLRFRCCPLGLQLYTQRPLAMFKVLSLNLAIPDESGSELRATCEGIVVQCLPDRNRGLHRIWVLFTRIPDDFRRRLQCWSKKAGTQCPHCLNY